MTPRRFSSRLGCPACGLTLTVRAPWLMVEHCPRCLARRRTAVPLAPTSPPPAGPGGGARPDP